MIFILGMITGGIISCFVQALLMASKDEEDKKDG